MNRWLVWILIPLLIVAQQDYWQWDNTSLLLGFLPYSLAWHMGVSLLAAACWWAITQFAWPSDDSLIQQVPGDKGETP